MGMEQGASQHSPGGILPSGRSLDTCHCLLDPVILHLEHHTQIRGSLDPARLNPLHDDLQRCDHDLAALICAATLRPQLGEFWSRNNGVEADHPWDRCLFQRFHCRVSFRHHLGASTTGVPSSMVR